MLVFFKGFFQFSAFVDLVAERLQEWKVHFSKAKKMEINQRFLLVVPLGGEDGGLEQAISTTEEIKEK